MPTKYISKSRRMINENLRSDQYIYRDRVDVYLTPRDASQPTLRISIDLNRVAEVLNDYDNLTGEEPKKLA